MDELQHDVSRLVSESLADGRGAREIFAAVCGLAGVTPPPPGGRRTTPRLTEAWFC
jgi:hypothetical protein